MNHQYFFFVRRVPSDFAKTMFSRVDKLVCIFYSIDFHLKKNAPMSHEAYHYVKHGYTPSVLKYKRSKV